MATAERARGRILVTGGAGYIGSVLTEMLLSRGYAVTVLDRFFFGDTLAHLKDDHRLRLVRDDVRTCAGTMFDDIDAVCDLAALSNDPAGELDPRKTMEINFEGRARVCRLARRAGVKRYVLASSCSIYGFQDHIVDETSTVNPLTTYAHANTRAEEAALGEGSGRYCVTALRQATVYGASRRMRFDLAINGMTLAIFKTGRVRILRDGTQWRPMLHVRDACAAFASVLETDTSLVDREIFNVGSDDQNLQIRPLAERVAAAVGVPFQPEWYGDPDHRSYRVSFRKIAERLAYRAMGTPEDGAREIHEGLRSGALRDGPETRTVDWYRELLRWHAVTRDVAMNGAIL